MKVIAIKDAPITKHGYSHRGKFYDKAYSIGDVFEVHDRTTWGTEVHLIIYHDKLETNMDVDPDNFITLREYREIKLKELGI
jgi:hypothetical protein